MIRSRWFVVQWVPKVVTWKVLSSGRKQSRGQVLTVGPDEGQFNIALDKAMSYLEVVSGKFVGTRNQATSFRHRVDADRYAFEIVQKDLSKLGKIEVRRLRQKLGPRALLTRTRTCLKCGTYSIYTKLNFVGDCTDPNECFRRQQMKMGKPVLPRDGATELGTMDLSFAEGL